MIINTLAELPYDEVDEDEDDSTECLDNFGFESDYLADELINSFYFVIQLPKSISQ